MCAPGSKKPTGWEHNNISDAEQAASHTAPPRWRILLAFAAIYFLWGSTFLAIRIGVHAVPPFLLAAIRFVVAGLVLLLWMLARGVPFPTARQWRSALVLGLLVFVLDYGLLFWAEQRVPSGVAAVMMATIPAFMTLSEITILRTRRMTAGLAAALVCGLAGVAVLVLPSTHLGGQPISAIGAVALVIAAISWSIGAALTRKLPLPDSRAMTAGIEMLAGGVLLAVTAGSLGEVHGFSLVAVPTRAWLALGYLIVAGSLIGFTAFIWLIHHESPTRVGTYAYVNPVVAVLLGYFAGGEALGARTAIGTALVLTSVIAITTSRRS
jgi:drug/metabolite transporter (DMT)-like permease